MSIFCSQQFRGIFVSEPHNPHRTQYEYLKNIFFLKQKNSISEVQELSFEFQGIFRWD